MCQISFDQKFEKPELAQMQHEENGCEKVLWPFLETKNGSRLHKNLGIYLQKPTGKTYSCECIFL